MYESQADTTTQALLKGYNNHNPPKTDCTKRSMEQVCVVTVSRFWIAPGKPIKEWLIITTYIQNTVPKCARVGIRGM